MYATSLGTKDADASFIPIDYCKQDLNDSIGGQEALSMVKDDGLKLTRTRTDRTTGLIGELELLGIECEWHTVDAELQDRLLILHLKSDPEEQESVSGVIDLAAVRKVELLPSDASARGEDKYKDSKAFTLFLSSRSITLKAETSKEATNWMQALKSASLPSGSCSGDKQQAADSRQPIKEVEPQHAVTADGSKVKEEESRGEKTPSRAVANGSGEGGVRFVGAYTPKPGGTSSASRSNSERRYSRGSATEAWRQKENLAPMQQAGSLRDALRAERMEDEAPSVQVEKKGASAVSETSGTSSAFMGSGGELNRGRASRRHRSRRPAGAAPASRTLSVARRLEARLAQTVRQPRRRQRMKWRRHPSYQA